MDAEQGHAGLSTAKGPARPHLHKADSGEQLLGISCHSLPSLPGQECSPLAGNIHTNSVTGNRTMELWKGPARISESNSSAGRHSCTGPGLHTPGPRELILLSSKPQNPGRNSPQRAGIVFLWLKGSVGSHKNGGSTIPLPSTTLGPSHQCP